MYCPCGTQKWFYFPSFFRTQGTERLSNLCVVTQHKSGEAKIQTRSVKCQDLHSQQHSITSQEHLLVRILRYVRFLGATMTPSEGAKDGTVWIPLLPSG